MKKLLILPLAAAAIALTAVPASAHTPNIEAKCQTLTVDLKWYEQGSKVTVTIDGVSTTKAFGPNYHAELSGTIDGRLGKTWSVKVDNNGPKHDRYDFEQSGTFVDCTPATTSTTSTTTVPVVTAPPVIPAPATVGFFVFDCTIRLGAVQFVNDSPTTDHLSVGGTPLDVPGNGFARLSLDTLEGSTVMLGPVHSYVTNEPVVVNGRESVNALGDVTTTCLDTAVLDRAPVATPVLAFTGARSNIMAAVAAVLIFFGALCMFTVRRMAR